jgi:hypothetical protein
MHHRLASIALLLLALVARPMQADNASSPVGKGQSYVLIVSGHPGNEMYARHYRDRVARFHKYFTHQAHVPAANVAVLSGDAGFKDALVSGPATAERFLATLADLGKKVKPEDQLILVLLAHGETSDEGSTLMLPGPDLEYKAMAEAVNRIAAGNQVVLNFASNSGDSIAPLSRVGRAVVTAGLAGQVNDSDFAEFFLQALETGAVDSNAGAKPPAKIHPLSLLAAYNWAVIHTAEWTVRQKFSADPEQPGWTVEGKQSAEIFQRLYGGGEVPADRRFVPSPDSEQPDAPVLLVCNSAPLWEHRRLITDNPALEDVGQGKGKADVKGLSALGEKGYQPLRGKSPAEIGFLARQVVLGDPRLLATESEGEQVAPADRQKEKVSPKKTNNPPAKPKKAKSPPKKAKTPPAEETK